MTILTKDNCDAISSIFIQLFKAKLNLARSTPNAILLNRWIYNYRDLYGVQLQAKLSNFLIALNHQSLLGKVTNIRLLQIQSKYGLDCNPVISWPLDSIANRANITFLEGLLTLCKKHNFLTQFLKYIVMLFLEVIRLYEPSLINRLTAV